MDVREFSVHSGAVRGLLLLLVVVVQPSCGRFCTNTRHKAFHYPKKYESKVRQGR